MRAPFLRKKRTFRRRAKKAQFRTPRMTPVPLHRPLTLVGRVAEISTFSLSQSSARAAPTGKHTHVYTASSWVQTWKQNWNSCPFSIFMIKTNFTLFLLKKTTKNLDFRKNIFDNKSMHSYFFSWANPRSRPDLAYSTKICTKNAEISIEKLDPKSKKIAKIKMFLIFFFTILYLKKIFWV